VVINEVMVNIPSYRVKEGTEIFVKENYTGNIMIEDSIKLAKAIDSVPEWLEVDFEKRRGKVMRLPVRQDIPTNFNEQLVVELYSK
jgi:small subunit ribosomal protein S4